MNCQHICIVNIRVFITSGLVGATFQSNILAWFVQILPKAATTAAFLNVSFRFVLVKVRTVWFYEGEENRDACWYYMFVFQSIRLLRIKPGLGQFGSWGLYSRCCKDNWAPSLRDLPRSTQTERKADACWFQGIPFLTKKSLHSLLALRSHTVFCWMLLLCSQFGWKVRANRAPSCARVCEQWVSQRRAGCEHTNKRSPLSLFHSEFFPRYCPQTRLVSFHHFKIFFTFPPSYFWA